MKKVNIVLLIISVAIIILGIIIGICVSNEILKQASTNEINSGIGEKYSGIIEIFGFFGAKIIGTMIIVFSIVIDIVMWLFYVLILICIKIIRKIKKQLKKNK